MAPTRSKDYSQLLVGVLLASLVLLLDLVGFLSWYKNFRSYVLHPGLTAFHNVSVGITEATISAFKGTTLRKENLVLRQKVLELESLSTQYAEQLKATSALQQLYETTKVTTFKSTEKAQILDLHAERLAGKLLLNKGATSGIKEGMPVTVANYYLGYITSVTPYESTCTTYEIPGQEFVGYIQSKKITGIVRVGINGMELGDLLATEQVALHDVVSLRKEGYPYYLTLGTITKIPLNNGSAERTAIVNSPLMLTNLTYVTIIKQ